MNSSCKAGSFAIAECNAFRLLWDKLNTLKLWNVPKTGFNCDNLQLSIIRVSSLANAAIIEGKILKLVPWTSKYLSDCEKSSKYVGKDLSPSEANVICDDPWLSCKQRKCVAIPRAPPFSNLNSSGNCSKGLFKNEMSLSFWRLEYNCQAT